MPSSWGQAAGGGQILILFIQRVKMSEYERGSGEILNPYAAAQLETDPIPGRILFDIAEALTQKEI
jgi:hypothetical protein